MTSLIFPIIIVAFYVISRIRVPLNRTRPVVSLYLAILLISVPVFYAVAEPSEALPVPPSNEINQDYWDEYHRQTDAFYNALFENRIEESDEAKLSKQWRFDYDQDRLLIATSDSRQYNSQIFIKRKNGNDGKIDVAIYTPTHISGSNIVHDPPELKLSENRLEIIIPPPIHVVTYRFFHDFTVAQFTGGSGIMDSRGHFFHGDSHVLYLQIPADLIIDTDHSTDHRLIFINE